jgi:hypothetical protein
MVRVMVLLGAIVQSFEMSKLFLELVNSLLLGITVIWADMRLMANRSVSRNWGNICRLMMRVTIM